MNEKLSITLPAEMITEINLQVESGRYASPTEVLQRAMQALAREQAEHAERIAEVRANVARALADPRPPVPAREAFERLRSHIRDRFER